MSFIPPGEDGRKFGHMDEQPARIDPGTDRATVEPKPHPARKRTPAKPAP